MYNHICTYYYHNMTLTAHMIGTYLIIDANTIHKKRGCNRMRFYRILVTVPLKYKKHQEN